MALLASNRLSSSSRVLLTPHPLLWKLENPVDQTQPGAGSIYIEILVTVTAIATNGTPQRFRGRAMYCGESIMFLAQLQSSKDGISTGAKITQVK
jgi:hypothetical protein